jgi:hypothetical protein
MNLRSTRAWRREPDVAQRAAAVADRDVGATEPGRPFYFRIQGAALVIEFDNSGGNHVHSVWRDVDGDWGRDVLAGHYRSAGPDHPHGRR